MNDISVAIVIALIIVVAIVIMVVKGSKKHVEQKPKLDTMPIIVGITNTTMQVKTARVFGFNHFAKHEDYGCDKGVNLWNGYSNSNYFSILAESLQGFRIGKMLIISSTIQQVRTPLYLKKQTCNGEGDYCKITPETKEQTDPPAEIHGAYYIEINQPVQITAANYLELQIQPGMSVELHMFKEKV